MLIFIKNLLTKIKNPELEIEAISKELASKREFVPNNKRVKLELIEMVRGYVWEELGQEKNKQQKINDISKITSKRICEIINNYGIVKQIMEKGDYKIKFIFNKKEYPEYIGYQEERMSSYKEAEKVLEEHKKAKGKEKELKGEEIIKYIYYAEASVLSRDEEVEYYQNEGYKLDEIYIGKATKMIKAIRIEKEIKEEATGGIRIEELMKILMRESLAIIKGYVTEYIIISEKKVYRIVLNIGSDRAFLIDNSKMIKEQENKYVKMLLYRGIKNEIEMWENKEGELGERAAKKCIKELREDNTLIKEVIRFKRIIEKEYNKDRIKGELLKNLFKIKEGYAFLSRIVDWHTYEKEEEIERAPEEIKRILEERIGIVHRNWELWVRLVLQEIIEEKYIKRNKKLKISKEEGENIRVNYIITDHESAKIIMMINLVAIYERYKEEGEEGLKHVLGFAILEKGKKERIKIEIIKIAENIKGIKEISEIEKGEKEFKEIKIKYYEIEIKGGEGKEETRERRERIKRKEVEEMRKERERGEEEEEERGIILTGR